MQPAKVINLLDCNMIQSAWLSWELYAWKNWMFRFHRGHEIAHVEPNIANVIVCPHWTNMDDISGNYQSKFILYLGKLRKSMIYRCPSVKKAKICNFLKSNISIIDLKI